MTKIKVSSHLPYLLVSKNVMAGLVNDPDVLTVQKRLNEIHSGFKLKLDGTSGPRFAAAIEEVQHAYHLDQDGNVGPRTRQVLRLKLSVEVPAPPTDPKEDPNVPQKGSSKDPYNDGPPSSSKGYPRTSKAVDHDHDVREHAPWLDWMDSYLGSILKTGAKPTAFDQFLFDHTDFGKLKRMVAGCAATVCTALEETGYKSCGSARALDHAKEGVKSEKKIGAIVVLKLSTGYHVTFLHKILGGGRLECLGGNQGHMIKDSVFNERNVIAYRWPVKADPIRKDEMRLS